MKSFLSHQQIAYEFLCLIDIYPEDHQIKNDYDFFFFFLYIDYLQKQQ